MSGEVPRSSIGEVNAKVDGLRLLVEQGFKNIQRQVDEDEDLPTTVARLDERVEDLENHQERRWVWTRGPLLIACVSLLGVLAQIIANHH